MKIVNISLLSLLLFSVVSCINDEGNYDYTAPIEIHIIEEPENTYTALRAIEPIVINQTIKSSIDGDIKESDQNMEFSYRINVLDDVTKELWTILSEGKMNFNRTLDLPAGAYKLWFQMKNKRNGMTSSKAYNITISSPTYEGWMILGTEGANNNTRMDMISVISSTREVVNYDLMKSRGLPADTQGAQCFGWYPNNYANPGDKVSIFADNGGYILEKEEFNTSDKSTINFVDFILPTKLTDPVAIYTYNGNNLLVTTKGDAFAQKLGTAGARFQDPINITVKGRDPEFKVAPYIGYNAIRPKIMSSLAVFFDETNRRFMGFNATTPGSEVLYPLIGSDADNKFNFNIDMNLIYMVGTAYDNGVTFALLKDDAGRYNLAGMSVVANIKQYNYVEDIQAPELSNAQHFAFHSKFPLMFYAVGNKVYSYNWANNTVSPSPVITLDSEVTMLKFQLYANSVELPKYDDPAFVDQQYNLLVASHSGSENGGKLGFYKTSDVDYSISKVKEYSGFCKIKDVIYRERR